jgi:hypothetical protein
MKNSKENNNYFQSQNLIFISLYIFIVMLLIILINNSSSKPVIVPDVVKSKAIKLVQIENDVKLLYQIKYESAFENTGEMTDELSRDLENLFLGYGNKSDEDKIDLSEPKNKKLIVKLFLPIENPKPVSYIIKGFIDYLVLKYNIKFEFNIVYTKENHKIEFYDSTNLLYISK